MDRKKLLTQLELLLNDDMAWQYDRTTGTYSATVGEYHLVVRKVEHRPGLDGAMNPMELASMNVMWSVRHDQYGEVLEETPAAVALRGKREAVDFTRAHILGQHEPQHAG